MKKWHTVQDYLVIVFCACLLALSYHIFVFPNEFAPSGLPGIATIIQHVFHFKVGYMTILINVPLVLLTYYIVDHRYAVLSATFAVVFSVVLLALDYVNLAPFEYHTTTGTSTILAPIAGGVISGFCYGMVMRRDSSTGGTDLLAALVHHVRPEMHIIWIVFAINAIVAALSYFVYDFKIEPVILCLIYCFLSSHVGDTMIKGFKEAVKFEGGRITAEICRENADGQDSVVIRIRDFGPGIPEEELPLVKKKFYKGASKARGSGIGLAVCEEIVTMHNGVLDIANAEGGGAVVTIRLPIAEQ